MFFELMLINHRVTKVHITMKDEFSSGSHMPYKDATWINTVEQKRSQKPFLRQDGWQ